MRPPAPSAAGPYAAVYLSPHLDDAVLSCGGQIHRRTAAGEAVLVVTVFAGDEPADPLPRAARRLHRAWGLAAGAAAARRGEDAEACRIVGADAVHWGLPEAIYRRGPGGQPLYRRLGELFGEPRAADAGRVAEVAGLVSGLPEHRRLLVPLGVGGHVDHQVLRAAVARAGGPGPSYYEEFPYARRRRAVRRALGRRRDWEAEIVALSEEDVAARCRAIAAYRSQIPALFGDAARMERWVRRGVRRVGGERLWRRR